MNEIHIIKVPTIISFIKILLSLKPVQKIIVPKEVHWTLMKDLIKMI